MWYFKPKKQKRKPRKRIPNASTFGIASTVEIPVDAPSTMLGFHVFDTGGNFIPM